MILQLDRNQFGRCGSYRLVGFLRILRLRLIEVRLFRHDLGAEFTRDHRPDIAQGIGRQGHRVGSHVGDQALVASADVDAFVELLGNSHRALGREPKPASGFLLQGRGDERRLGASTSLALGDPRDFESSAGRIVDRPADFAGLRFVGDVELFNLVPVELDQIGRELLILGIAQVGLDGPVFARFEGLDLLLADDDHAQGRRLDPSSRQTATNLLPQQRREIEADQIIERPARLLRVYQRAGKAARLAHRLVDRALGDFGEDHALDGHFFLDAPLFQDLGNVPGNGLAFAVEVGRQINGIGLSGRGDDLVDVLFVAVDDVVVHGEIMLGVDRTFLGDQVTNMAVGGKNLEVLAQIFVDRGRFGRRLDNK